LSHREAFAIFSSLLRPLAHRAERSNEKKIMMSTTKNTAATTTARGKRQAECRGHRMNCCSL
jgi:hypothetical protein